MADEVSALLHAAAQGDRGAYDALFPRVYDKLRRMARSEREATTAILENDTGPRRHEARAERAVETIDEGDDVPLPIGNHEVDGVASRPDARLDGLCGPTGIDAGRQPTKLRFVEEGLHRRLPGVRIRHMGVPIG